MISSFQRLLIATLLVSSVRGEILKAKDAQMCANLCSSCDGSATFVNEICTCLIPENDERAAHCMNHLKQQIEDPTTGAKAAEGIANRAARCSGQLGATSKIGSADIDRVASYFINGGPLIGSSLLGSSNSECVSSSNNETTEASNPLPQPERLVSKTPSLDADAPKIPLLSAQAPKSPIACASCGQSPVVSSPRLPSLGLHPALGTPHPLGILQPHDLTALHLQLLAGMRYPGLLGASQHTHLNPLLGALATGVHGIIQNVDNLVSAYVPARNREHQVGSPQNQLADAIMGIPNGLLGAARIPAYVPGVLQATHYSPLLGAAASRTHDVLHNLDNLVSTLTPGSHRTNMVGAPQVQDSQSSTSGTTGAGASAPSVGSQAAQQPSRLHQILAHHNTLLEALSQHLRSIGPQVRAAISPYIPQCQNAIVGSANSMSSCPLQKQASPTIGANPIAAETSGQSDEPVNTKVSEDTDVQSAANSNTSNDSTASKQEAVESKNEDIAAEANETITGNAEEETVEQAESTNEVITGNAKQEATKQAEEPAIDAKTSVDGGLCKPKREVYFSTRRKRQNDKYMKKRKTPLLPLRAL